MDTRPTILLAIEASNPSLSNGDEGSAAVCRIEGSVVHPLSMERLRAGSRHDDALMRAVDDACRAAKVKPRDISRVAVSAGPGGYTGLRIALTSAKMLGDTLGAELIPVPTARVATFGFVEGDRDPASQPFIVTLASKRESAWCQPFRGVDALDEGALCDAEGLRTMIASSGASTVLADEHLPRAMREVVDSSGIRVTPPRLDALLCARASIGLASVGVDALAPIYPREPEAVRKWNAKDGQ